MKKTVCLSLLLVFAHILFAQDESRTKGLNAIRKDVIKAQLEFLASDWTEGRETATPGAYMAADYIASLYQIYGLQPGGDHEWTDVSREERREGKRPEKYRSYFQNFKLIKADESTDNLLGIKTADKDRSHTTYFDYQTDYSFYGSSTTGLAFEADVVFVGYGYVNGENNYDDYRGVDVEGKIILRLPGYPGFDDTTSKAYQTFTPEEGYRSYWYKMRREKDKIAREKAVLAVIDIPYGDIPDSWAKNYPFRYNLPYYEGDVRQKTTYDYSLHLPEDTLKTNVHDITVSKRLYHKLIEGEDLDIEAYKKRAADKLKPGAMELKGKRIVFNTRPQTQIVQARNVIGVIEGKKSDEIIVVGAHYDHLGKSDGYIWNGADDNASGTVAVMTMARAMMESGIQPEKTIVFACWTGEEKGLLGSRYFVENPYGDTIEHIILNMNYDMISRDPYGDTLGVKGYMSYFEDFPILKELTEKHIEEFDLNLDFNLRPSAGGRGGSDHAPFSMKGIPFSFVITGMHEDYHRPTDHVSKVNYDKMLDVIKLGYLNLWELANVVDFKKQKKD